MDIKTHPALRRRGDIVTTSLCTSQRRRRYFPNETPNDVSMERRQNVSVVRLHNILLERRNDVSKGHNNDVPSERLQDVSKSPKWNTQRRLSGTFHDVPLARLYDVSFKSQIEHPKTLLWYVSTTSPSYVFATSC